MKNPNFITIQGDNYAYDYPKNCEIPNIDDIVFIANGSFKVVSRNFHVNNNKLTMITINTTKA